jgi:hypothetical protein
MPSLKSEVLVEFCLGSNWSFEEIVAKCFERIIVMTKHHDKNIAAKVAY